MGKTLYLECASGISGDMVVASLLDLGANERHLREALASLPLAGYEVVVSEVAKNGVRARDFDVRLQAELENHDHDMAWLYGHLEGDAAPAHMHEHEQADDSGHDHPHAHEGEHSHKREGASMHGCNHHHDEDEHHHGHSGRELPAHVHDGETAHCQEHENECNLPHEHGDNHSHHHAHEGEHSHEGAHHHHEHRGLADVLAIIDAGTLTQRARRTAQRVFEVLAQAEAQAHGTTPEKVHFHEVGAVDSIVDIVSAAVCLDALDIDEVVVPFLCEGSGTVRCAHGILPVPVPAVCATVAQHDIALHVLPVQGELVTPTGAAIVAATRTQDKLPAAFRITATGVGAGKRDNKGTSGILRAHLIEADAPQRSDTQDDTTPREIWKLECDVDDCTGEALGYCMEALLAAGAKEAHFVPVFTKKNRPAWQIQVICDEERRECCENILFLNTTTIGVRRQRMERTVLVRRPCKVETPLGTVDAKTVELPGGQTRTMPEHDSLAALAHASGKGYQEVLRIALASMPPESPCGQA